MQREFSAGGVLVRRLRGRWVVAAIRPAGKREGVIAGAIHGGARGPPLGVDARGIAVGFAQDPGHRLGDFGVDGSRRGVVEVDAVHL